MVKTKTRVGLIVKESIGVKKSTNKSADLQSLIDRFYIFKKKLSAFMNALKQHHLQMVQFANSRVEVCMCVENIPCPT